MNQAVSPSLDLVATASACILTLPQAQPDDVPSFKKTRKHLIGDSIFITTLLMMGCSLSNQVRKLLQTDHIWNFTIAVLPFAAVLQSCFPPTALQSSQAGRRRLLCAKSSYFVIATK